MKAFVVDWHPEPKRFNHAMFIAAHQALTDGGWDVVTSDLHAMAFDPVSGRANFRGVMDPDDLKLQVEETHATEVGGRSYDQGVVGGERAMVSLTTSGPADACVKGGCNGDIHGILRPIHRGRLQFVGFDMLAPHSVNAPVRMTDEQSEAERERFGKRPSAIARETPIDVGQC